MKLSESKLRNIIREESQRTLLTEGPSGPKGVTYGGYGGGSTGWGDPKKLWQGMPREYKEALKKFTGLGGGKGSGISSGLKGVEYPQYLYLKGTAQKNLTPELEIEARDHPLVQSFNRKGKNSFSIRLRKDPPPVRYFGPDPRVGDPTSEDIEKVKNGETFTLGHYTHQEYGDLVHVYSAEEAAERLSRNVGEYMVTIKNRKGSNSWRHEMGGYTFMKAYNRLNENINKGNMRLTESKLRNIIREELSKITEASEYQKGRKLDPRDLQVGKEIVLPTGARATVRQKNVEAVKRRLQRMLEKFRERGEAQVGNIPARGRAEGKSRMTLRSTDPLEVEAQYALPGEINYTDEQTFRGSLDEVAENVAAWAMHKSILGGYSQSPGI